MRHKRLFLLVVIVLVFALVMAACAPAEEPAPEEPAEEEPMEEEPAEEEAEEPAEEAEEPAEEEPMEEEEMEEEEPMADPMEAWAASAHNAADTEAFTHWDEDDPAEIPTFCAKCHSEGGALDFFGVDGTEFGVVDNAAAIGTTVTCDVCHNDAAESLTSVVMPSGVEITDLGPSAVCMQCHQGRSSTLSVNLSVTGAEAFEEGLGYTELAEVDLDAVNEELGFINIHYYAAAASLFGSETHGGYEYDGKAYQIRFEHAAGITECTDCHEQHSLEIDAESCAGCHGDTDLESYRMQGSLEDYDGDSDVSEGIKAEIEGLQEILYAQIQTYAAETIGTGVAYESHSYPYFFIDTDGDGTASEEEAIYPNQYASWTPRLLMAAYNYQVSAKDPGAYAHNAKYVIALLYDSIEDLGGDVSGLHRNDPGHFDGTAEAFRHWDEDDPAEVPDRCAKCHSSEGLAIFFETGEVTAQPPANSIACHSCHAFEDGISVLGAGTEVTFPSGAALSFGDDSTSNLCINCHQGRASTVSMDEALADLDADTVDAELGFQNIHYFAAGATLFGNEAMGAYQYEGKEYAGRFEHVDGYTTCGDCHSVHALEVKVEDCAVCHGSEDVAAYRIGDVDFDGDGDVEEGVVGEIDTLAEALYAEIQAYANANATPVIYDSHAYPYFFEDTNANGTPDPGEGIYPNKYANWTPRLLRAAYNYQYSQKDPGAFAHNVEYVVQVLIDSIEDLGGDVSGYTRP